MSQSLPLPDGEDTCVEYVQENPKKIGSLSAARYDVYKGSKTVKEAKANGATRADFDYDYKKGYLKIVNRSSADGSSEPTKPKTAAEGAAEEGEGKKEQEKRDEAAEKGGAGEPEPKGGAQAAASLQRKPKRKGGSAARLKASVSKAVANLPRRSLRQSGSKAGKKEKKDKKDKKEKKEKKDKKDKKEKKSKKVKKDKKARKDGPLKGNEKTLADLGKGAATDSKGLLVRTHGKHSSRYLGVSLDRETKKWQATLVLPSGVRRDLGQFGTEKEAAREYTSAVRKEEVLLSRPPAASAPAPAAAKRTTETRASSQTNAKGADGGSPAAGDWTLAKSITELNKQLEELGKEQMLRVKKFLQVDQDRSIDNDYLLNLPVSKLRELTGFIAKERASTMPAQPAAAPPKPQPVKANQPAAAQRMPTGAPLPTAARARPTAASRLTAPAGQTADAVAPGKPSLAASRAPAAAVPGRAPAVAAAAPPATPTSRPLSARGPSSAGPAVPAGSALPPALPAGALPSVLAPDLRAPKTPPLKRPGSGAFEASALAAQKVPRIDGQHAGQHATSHEGGQPGGFANKTAPWLSAHPLPLTRSSQTGLPGQTLEHASASSRGFNTTWAGHAGNAHGVGSGNEAALAAAPWKQPPASSAPPCQLKERSSEPVPALEPLIWLGDFGNWVPGRGPHPGLQMPRISQGCTYPPGPCQEGCRCNQVASHPRDLDKPWLEDKPRAAAVQCAMKRFMDHPGVLRRGTVSNQNRFQPAPVGVYDRQRFEQPRAALTEPPPEATEGLPLPDRSPPTGPVPQ